MGLFNSYTKPGKGISKEDVDKSGIALYFDILLRRFWKLITVNIFYIIASIPAIIIAYFIASWFLMSGFSNLLKTTSVDTIATAVTLYSIPIAALILQIFGSGPATVAMTSIVGKYVKDTHAWVWSDFIDGIKSNFKQGMAVYIINTVVLFLSVFAFLFYTFVMKDQMANILRTVIMVFIIIFSIMQMYTYRLVAEFELKIKHIYKNALLLTVVGLKWNLLAIAVGIGFIYGMFSLFAGTAGLSAIGLIVVIAIYFTLTAFNKIFITNNVIKKYMLEPSLKMQTEQEKEEQ